MKFSESKGALLAKDKFMEALSTYNCVTALGETLQQHSAAP